MVFWLLMHMLTLIVDFFTLLGIMNGDKDLEIVLLRQQVRILQRTVKSPPRITTPERMILAALTDKYKQSREVARQRLHQVLLIFKPATVLGWHRELVRRKWTFRRKGNPGRPRMTAELETLIVRLAKENPRWGYDKIQGELQKLGYKLGATSVRSILKRHRIAPAPLRSAGSWRSFLRHYKNQILACDFFTVETIWFKTIYVLFFIELGTRRIHLAGCTPNPNQTWVTQQARQLVWNLQDDSRNIAFLIHDNDGKFTSSSTMCFHPKRLKSFTPLTEPRKRMRLQNAGCAQFERSVLIIS